MAQGTGGVPGNLPQLPTFNAGGGQSTFPSQTQITPQNIFDTIKQGYSQSYSSVLPYVQNQLGQQSQAIAPQLAAIRQSGEQNAAMAQSDAGNRGMRGSDIEAASMQGARQASTQQEAQLRGQVSMQQAQTMAEAIMKMYGMDVQANQDLHNNLAQAIGQELSQQREIQMHEQALAQAKAAANASRHKGLISSLIGSLGSVASGIIGGPIGAAMFGVGKSLLSGGGGGQSAPQAEASGPTWMKYTNANKTNLPYGSY